MVGVALRLGELLDIEPLVQQEVEVAAGDRVGHETLPREDLAVNQAIARQTQHSLMMHLTTAPVNHDPDAVRGGSPRRRDGTARRGGRAYRRRWFDSPAATRMRRAAVEMFARDGFGGTSTRQIVNIST